MIFKKNTVRNISQRKVNRINKQMKEEGKYVFDDGSNPFEKTVMEKIQDYFNNGSNIFPKPMSDYEFKQLMKDHFLGANWYTPNPVSDEQANVYIADAIINKFRKGRKIK